MEEEVKTYKIFKHPNGEIQAVKQGWSWPGFFFGGLWALIKKLWGVAILLFIIGLMIKAFSFIISISQGIEVGLVVDRILFSIFGITTGIVLGINGNKLREKKLISNGFEYKDIVNANNPQEAIALWLKKSKDE